MNKSNPENNNIKENGDPTETKQKAPDLENRAGEEDQLNYYNEYCRLYLANAVLSTQLKELNTEKAELLNKLCKL